MSKLSKVWVFSDAASRLPEIIGGGLLLGEKVSAFVIGSKDDVARAHSLGAAVVHHLGEADPKRIVEDYADTMARVISEGEKPCLVLLAGTRRGKSLAARLGARLDAGVVNDAASVASAADGVATKRMIYGGLAIGEEKIASPVSIVSVSNGAFEAAAADPSRTGETVTVDFVEPGRAIRCVERRPKQGSSVDLNKAKRIVSVGRGIAKREDIKMAEELCAVIGAELGCSRPIAEGEKWMERERYVGISGVMPKPDVYLALGISGQIQHMVGANGAQTIIAVNKDKKAPIFQYADYGLVGDLYKVVPALISALKG
ncbi:FAD-binding protein [Desulfovibrio aminophilus]|uniref:FAD-binding protein n=1 Tax=Desulfovibrio aminophilus TaxID=81425 RepID=UPI003398D7A0